MSKHPQWYVWLCYLAVPLSGVGVDVYTPSLPSITHYFHTSATLAQLSLSVYLLGFGFSQLIAGPITDRSGRKPMLVFSLIVYIILSLLISFSSTPWELLLGRCLQGIAGAGISVPVRAILADISDKDTFKKRINYMIFAWGLGPILAPWIGSYLQHAFGWQSTFYFLAAYGVVALTLTVFVKETHAGIQEHRQKPILSNYKIIFGTRSFVPVTLFLGFIYSIMIAYGMVAPFLVEEKLGLSVLVFGRTALLMGVAWVLGSLCNRAFIHAKNASKLYVSFICMIIAMLVMGYESRHYPNSLSALIVPVAVLIFFGSVAFATLVTDTLARFQSLAGSANAALFAVLWVFAGIVSSAVSHLPLHSSFLFAVTLLAITLLATAVYIFVIRILHKREERITN